ncbi:MAG: 4-(cytidine 5'-diphospho)-2-C-methyl-D-erythritol kinase [Deltaproteobacteria bacterium]|nr:4-(cytidine 5'-diphospho)-2-C-methyl-D-erythritol kinase [Deltaproteobacteria bacterium]
MSVLTFKAPAKINLRLKILGKRADGYHEIETLMQRIGLWDTIRLRPGSRGTQLVCPGYPELEGRHNLAVKALDLLSEELGRPLSFRIHLTKRIPMGAGLGGGSSDGAAVLKGVNDWLGRPVSSDRLFDLAARLGSDVPFFLLEQAAWARGRGERLEPAPGLPSWWVVLVFPGFPLSTSWVYGQLKIPLTKKNKRIIIKGLKIETDMLPAELLENDLEQAVFPRYPVLAGLKEALQRRGADGALMTGSGSTVFGLWPDKAGAVRAVQGLKTEGWKQVLLARGLP